MLAGTTTLSYCTLLSSSSCLTRVLWCAHAGEVDSSMAMMKPHLRINIPGSTAPELPYSQRPQAAGADLSRMDKVGWVCSIESWHQ
jgi:hypothetical protein